MLLDEDSFGVFNPHTVIKTSEHASVAATLKKFSGNSNSISHLAFKNKA
jgi:hypothetical protein